MSKLINGKESVIWKKSGDRIEKLSRSKTPSSDFVNKLVLRKNEDGQLQPDGENAKD